MSTTNDDIMRSLGNIEGQLTGIHSKLDTQHGRLNNHGERISRVERKLAWYAGAAGAFGAVAGYVISVIKGGHQ